MQKLSVTVAMLGAMLGGACVGDESLSETDQAASVHLKGGANAQPSFTDLGLALRANGALSGLGDGDVQIEMSATGSVTVECVNPSGEHRPPGRQPADVALSGTVDIPDSDIKNGTVPFTVQTGAAAAQIEPPSDCTNGAGAWDENVLDVSFSSATIDVGQRPPDSLGAYTSVLVIYCSFTPSTSNGLVPKANVSCD